MYKIPFVIFSSDTGLNDMLACRREQSMVLETLCLYFMIVNIVVNHLISLFLATSQVYVLQ